MKLKRHTKILELIHEYEIETQEELAQRLEEAGFKVTQATVSRDIRELCLTKVANKKGRSVYAVLQGQNPNLSEKYSRVLRDAFVSMDTAQNILVIKTVPGMAMGVAAALDELKFSEIIGSIAGDDTVISVIKTADQSLLVMEKLRKILEKL
ncbi:MAG: arginine repressor [Lachnospiraceae bacterium]|nr:arginine repressor [Lachnospiraceae bacterium]MDD6617947.1 arginine repressor [Clostridiales bacterium]MDY4771000.1 arginine repressor [Lachnospiraceae bacterium]